MKKLVWPIVALLALGCGNGSESTANAERSAFDDLRLEAADGTTVFAVLVETERVAYGVVLMFHQAGSNMHEYDPIAPEVANLGWDCLLVDQRAGGEMWGEVNLTKSQFTDDPGFLDAFQDLEAALAWADGKDYEKIIAWGSSYSASLVLRLAAENSSVDAVVSFSPGEYARLYPGGDKPEDGSLVAGWNADVGVPVFFASTGAERDATYKIWDTAPDTLERGRDYGYSSAQSVHGSSSLREDKNPEGRERYFDALSQFLRDVESDGRAFGG